MNREQKLRAALEALARVGLLDDWFDAIEEASRRGLTGQEILFVTRQTCGPHSLFALAVEALLLDELPPA
jgi:hypothetical protein